VVREEWERGGRRGEECAKGLYARLPVVLRGKMSDRFYDENEFFSEYMLFGRFGKERESMIYPRSGSGGGGEGEEEEGMLFDVFQEYLEAHIDMVQSSSLSGMDDTHGMQEAMERSVLEGQRQYDVYSAGRDPAHAMFTRVFGKDWADGYVHDYLFDLSNGGGRDAKTP